MPIGSNPVVLASMEWVITGLLTMTFLWFRPQGLLPEQRRKFARRRERQPVDVPIEEAVSG